MEKIAVTSSKIKAIAYDHPKGLLYVYFKNRNVYIHQHVPPNFWSECMLADSIGRYYFDNIRDTFPYEIAQELEGQEEE